MKITAVKLYTMHIPLITPFKTALRTVDAIDDLIVVLETDDGQRGFGEAPPTAVITGDTIPSVAGGITQFIAPKLIGREVEKFDELHDIIDKAMVHNTTAKAAVEMAVYDLVGKRWNVPLYKLLGGAKCELETDITISVNDVDTMVRDAVTAARLPHPQGQGGQRRVPRRAAPDLHQEGHARRHRDPRGCESGLDAQAGRAHHLNAGRCES